MENKITTPNILPGEEHQYDYTLRPKSLDEFIGQSKVKEKLKVYFTAAKNRKESLDHCLFYSPPGLGKTTLAYIISREMNVNIKTTSGPILDKVGDLAALLTDLSEGDVFFIDEIHRLNRIVEEALYPAMEDFKLDIMIGQGPSARSIKLDLPKFTLVGATTRAGALTSPLRERFGIVERLAFYDEKELEHIIKRSAGILNIEVENEGASELAFRSRGTPRIANRLLRRVRDFAEVKADGRITREVAADALKMLDVDFLGLDEMDRKILLTIIEKYNGGPVGLETIAIAVNEETDTITDVNEPFLIQKGLIKRTARGRMVTKTAYEHLGLKPDASAEQSDMF